MHRLFFVIISLFFFVLNSSHSYAYEKEIKTLSSTMAENIAKAGMKKVAVVDFVDLQGNITELGRFIAEEFSVALAGARKGFRLVDRTHLKAILKEHKLLITGMIDPTTAKKLGQISGADAIVTGTITPFGDSIRLAVKILDTATGDVVDALGGDIAKTKAIEKLLETEIEVPNTERKPSIPPVKAQQRVQAKDFIFELRACKAGGQAVSCLLTITNNGSDRELYILRAAHDQSKTRIFDNFGNEYNISTAQLGNKVMRSDHLVSSLLVSGVPTAGRFDFDSVSEKASMITLFELSLLTKMGGLRRGPEENFVVQFRNIPLTR